MAALKQLIRRVRKTGLFHKLGYARVALRCRLHPLPPKGKFPAASKAMKKPLGLVALGGNIVPETLLEAHRAGIFPMSYSGVLKWWAPDPREVLFLQKMRIEKRGLRKLVKSGRYRITFDAAFEEVVRACGERESTWLTEEAMLAYIALHRQGHAHSVEVWEDGDVLAGGLFGMASGRIFSTESAFQHAHDAIRVAFVYLNCHLQHWGFVLNDMQVHSRLAEALGCEAIPRDRYGKLLEEYRDRVPDAGTWSVDEKLDPGRWIPDRPGSQVNPQD